MAILDVDANQPPLRSRGRATAGQEVGVVTHATDERFWAVDVVAYRNPARLTAVLRNGQSQIGDGSPPPFDGFVSHRRRESVARRMPRPPRGREAAVPLP